MSKNKKKRGHYCKGCDRYRSNEKFNGKGHRKHMCKACQRASKKAKKQSRVHENEAWDRELKSDETFAFIAGFTEGGAPFGITHEEWEECHQTDLREEVEQFLNNEDRKRS